MFIYLTVLRERKNRKISDIYIYIFIGDYLGFLRSVLRKFQKDFDYEIPRILSYRGSNYSGYYNCNNEKKVNGIRFVIRFDRYTFLFSVLFFLLFKNKLQLLIVIHN